MPDPKNPTAAEKLMMLQAMGQQMVASGQPPSQQVQVALRSFQTAPTPEEIQRVAADMVRAGNPAGAVEFQAYASAMAGPQNKLRQDAQARADAGVGPSPPVVEALNSFDEPPSPQEIQTMRRFLQKKHGEAVGQEFETYAATALAQQAQIPPSAQPSAAMVPARPQVTVGPAQVEARQVGSFTTPGTMPPGSVSVDVGRARDIQPQPAPAQPQVQQASAAEPGLVQRAQDILQGTGHIVTLGAIPAPESVLSGNDRLRGMVGLEPLPRKKERKGKTEGYDEPVRDKNKERDLLNEAKKIDG